MISQTEGPSDLNLMSLLVSSKKVRLITWRDSSTELQEAR